jgi:predicted Zn finger-like uncharacterized protein
MTVKLICPECDAKLSVSDALIGKKVRCKKCGLAFTAKVSDTGHSEKAGVRGRTIEDEESEEPLAASKQRTPKKSGARRNKTQKRSKRLVIAVVVVGALVSLAALGGAVAYIVDGLYSSDIKATDTREGKQKQAEAPKVEDPVVEEITISEDFLEPVGKTLTYAFKRVGGP